MATSATVAMLFSDIEGSTRLLQDLGPGFTDLLLTHQELLRDVFDQYGGHEVRTEGDAFFITFERTSDAVAAALAGQRALLAHPWPDGAEVRVRMGIHTGEVTSIAGELVGLAIHAAARIASAGHGSQVLVSQLAADLAGRLPTDATWIDLGEHRLKDFAAPMRLFQLGHPELPASFPPIRSQGGSGGTNLPAQVTAFVGRDAEVSEVRELLSAARLVTVTGAGGAGKTRLALRVAAEPGRAFAEGIWLVDLAPITDATAIPVAVASALGLPESAAADLAVALAGRDVLLVIDNCEHLVAAVAELVAELLSRCPGLAVLATSREPLGLPGEIAWRLPSMPAAEATALFCARASEVNARFALSEDNRPRVEAICQRLDGIPLAIELAAARLASLGVDQLAERLDQRFKILTGGSRVALARQRTLEATVDWSYRLLDEAEQALLGRLGVFVGGFSLEAAEAVGDDANVLDVLDALVAKSLVVAEDRDGTVRYRLLETIRQFALDRLADGGGTEAARDAHLRSVTALAAQLASPLWLLTADDDERAIRRCDDEAPNIRAALEWAIETDQYDAAAEIAASIIMWWLRRSPREGYEWCDRVLASSGSGDHAGRVAFGRWLLATNFDNDDLPRRLVESTLAALATHTPESWRWLIPAFDAYAAMMRTTSAGHAKVAEATRQGRSLDDLVVQARAAADAARLSSIGTALAMALEGLTFVELNAGNVDAARATAEEAVAVTRRLQWAAAECRMELNVSHVEYRTGELDSAWRHLERALAVARRISDFTVVRGAAESLGAIAEQRADYGLACDLMLEALAADRELGGSNQSRQLENSVAWLAYLDGQFDLADAHAMKAVEALRRDQPAADAVAATLHIAGEVARCVGDLPRAWEHFRRGCEPGPTAATPDLLTSMAGVRVACGDAAMGAVLLAAGAALRTEDTRSPAQRRVADADERIARDSLGDANFKSASAEGSALTADDAIARVLAMEVPAPD